MKKVFLPPHPYPSKTFNGGYFYFISYAFKKFNRTPLKFFEKGAWGRKLSFKKVSPPHIILIKSSDLSNDKANEECEDIAKDDSRAHGC